MSEQLAERHAVKNPISRYTTLSGHRDAPTNQIDFRGGMSIGVDAHQAAKLKRTLMPASIKVQAPGIGVDFHRDPIRGTRLQHRLDVEIVTRATK
jgi:hypothetical protein